jgi:hypothetical protein
MFSESDPSQLIHSCHQTHLLFYGLLYLPKFGLIIAPFLSFSSNASSHPSYLNLPLQIAIQMNLATMTSRLTCVSCDGHSG